MGNLVRLVVTPDGYDSSLTFGVWKQRKVIRASGSLKLGATPGSLAGGKWAKTQNEKELGGLGARGLPRVISGQDEMEGGLEW